MINEAKSAILDRIIAWQDNDERVKAYVDAYATLCLTEVQARMTEWQTRECGCDECQRRNFPEVIN